MRARPDPELVPTSSAIAAAVSAGSGPTEPGVQVDPGAERRERPADRRELLVVGQEGRDHAPYDIGDVLASAGRRLPRTRTPGGLARPELLASTEWLADQLGRPEVRILDVRWRPDGSGRGVWAAGHIPGAVHVDWRADLTDVGESGDTLLLAGPEQVARTLASSPGSATARPWSSTTTPCRCSPPGRWWSLRVYGLESVRILDGGYPGLAARRAGRSPTPSRRRRRPTSRRGPSRGCG